ncbi:hypothetical protein [Microbacterium sp.]|uniref:hypothetical protein n=1 Tax=Microbacterium sp. TaxID=51671 RepID=UPI0039E4A488
MGKTVVVREVHGFRSVEFEVGEEHVYLETGDHCYRFDKATAIKALKEAFCISVIMEDGYALP